MIDSAFLTFMISLHNFFRWLIVIGILLIFALLLKNYIKVSKMQETEITNYLSTSLVWLKKFLFRYSLLVNIQLFLGFTLYFFNPSVLGSWNNFSEMIKQRELRMIAIEHPTLMIIFVGLVHMMNSRLENIDKAKDLRKVLIFSFISILVLFAGIPWFRPLLRFGF
ncbi:MAG: hypothetical protein RMI35_05880 [Leptospiraceae bacterium]|nr:hypothetical protein [Leptospiraceae bacterium]